MLSVSYQLNDVKFYQIYLVLNFELSYFQKKTKVYIDFMTQTSLPAPFNLIPTSAAFRSVAEFIKALVKPTPGKKARWNFKHCCYVVRILRYIFINIVSF